MWRLVVLTAGVVWGLGCSEAGVAVTAWRLDGRALTLPAQLPLEPRRQMVQLEADVEVPPPLRRGAMLELPVVHSLPALVVDGREALVVNPGWTERWRTSGSRRFLLPADALADGHVHLELVFEHRWALSAWWDVAPRLLPLDAGPGLTAFVRASGAFAFFTLLLLLFHVLNLLRVRFSAAAAWFMLEAASGVPYPAYMLGLLQGIGPFEPAFMGFSLCVSGVASVHFVRAQLGRPAPHVAWRWMVGVAFVAYLVAALDPFRLVLVGAPVTVGLMLAAAIEQLVTFQRARGTPVRGVALIWPFANLCAVPDMLMWLGQGELLGGVHPGIVGIGALVLAQSFVLSREHARSQVTTDELNVALAARVRELEQRQAEVQALNVELKHQLTERSRELERLAPQVASGQERALEAGELVAERYRVVRRIALGATGEVLEVARQPDGVALAMKVLQRNEPEDTARLAREARLIASLSHPHLVSIVDVGMSGDSLFLVMPLAVKSVRDERLQYGNRRWALSMLEQVADGLAALHAAGVVHRDVKPGNVLVTATGEYQVADLGAAAPQDAGPDEQMTASHLVIGTPLYMAPEMYDGARFVTAKADVFSFGVMAWEVLEGKLPRLEGQPVGKTLHRAPLSAPPAFPVDLGPLKQAFDASLAADPGARPTMDELHAALRAARAT
ncbi:MAG: serine/threonine-protein kinase [Myxococcaceae bacterium]|nr:serine/threonine-protein kinase [Myxococcaceae bacterium]